MENMTGDMVPIEGFKQGELNQFKIKTKTKTKTRRIMNE